MTYNKHKKTYKRSNKRSLKQRGGAWPSWWPFSSNKQPNDQQTYDVQQYQPSADIQQHADIQQGQPANSILGTFSNLTNKTESAFKNFGQGLGNLTNNAKNAFTGILPQRKQTQAQLDYQAAENNIQKADAAQKNVQMYDNAARTDFNAAQAAMPQRMIQEKNQMFDQIPQTGGMPPNLNITYPSWAGTTNVAKPTYWVNDNNQHIQKAGYKRSNKRRSNKRRSNKRRSNKRRSNRRH